MCLVRRMRGQRRVSCWSQSMQRCNESISSRIELQRCASRQCCSCIRSSQRTKRLQIMWRQRPIKTQHSDQLSWTSWEQRWHFCGGRHPKWTRDLWQSVPFGTKAVGAYVAPTQSGGRYVFCSGIRSSLTATCSSPLHWFTFRWPCGQITSCLVATSPKYKFELFLERYGMNVCVKMKQACVQTERVFKVHASTKWHRKTRWDVNLCSFKRQAFAVSNSKLRN